MLEQPWRQSPRAQFPGVPAWGVPSHRLRDESFDMSLFPGLSADWAWHGSDGDGIRVCVVDSGVDGNHPMAGPVEQAVAVDNESLSVVEVDPADVAGHGTACASVIRAIAPKVTIASVQVLTDGKYGSGPALLAGLRWAIDQGFELINLSVSTRKPELKMALYEAADLAYFRRSVLVVSANNMPVRGFPWTFASVLSVASHDSKDKMLHLYNPTPPVEFLARGVDVRVAWANGGTLTASGNSFAAPHITGKCALILARHPWLTPFQLKSVLYHTAANIEGRANERD
jgi:subtilisin family serine protease